VGDEAVEASAECGFTAAAGTREEDELSLVYGEVYAFQGLGFGVGIGVVQVSDLDDAQGSLPI